MGKKGKAYRRGTGADVVKMKHGVFQKSPCNLPPQTIDDADITFIWDKVGARRHSRMRLVVKWPEVTTDTVGFPVAILHYDVELSYSTDGGDSFEDDLIKRYKVPGNLDDDANLKAKIVIKGLSRKLFYRIRVRAVQKDCLGQWSNWTIIGDPDGPDPPAPEDVKIKRAHNGIRVRWHMPDDDDPEVQDIEVAGTIVELHSEQPFATAVTFTAATSDVLTATAHGMANDEGITVWGKDLPDPLVPNRMYFVVNRTDDTFKVALTIGGTAVNITETGAGWFSETLVARHRLMGGKERTKFRTDHLPGKPAELDEDGDKKFYAQARTFADDGSKSIYIPATAPTGNSDPYATPTGKRPIDSHEAHTFSILDAAVEAVYNPPDRAHDDHDIRRVVGDFDDVPTGSDMIIDILVNGVSIFDDDQDKMLHIPDGEDHGRTLAVVTGDVLKGQKIKVSIVQKGSSNPGGNGTITTVGIRQDRD